MPQPGPYTKTELKLRLRFVRDGLWNDRVLIFMDREVWVQKATVVGELVRIVGTERDGAISLETVPVNELIDPRDVTQVC